MPLVRRWKRSPLLVQLTFVTAVLIIIVGALVIALVAQNTALGAAQKAKSAADEAKSVAVCVNNVLAQRNMPTQKDAQAHIDYANANAANSAAQAAAANAELAVLIAPSGSAQQASDYQEFLRLQQLANDEATAYAKASVVYKQTLAADQADRDKHPLGTC